MNAFDKADIGNEDGRLGGMALIGGWLGLIVTMAFHPTGHELVEPGRFEAAAHVGRLVHALAIACLPFTFLGALALTRRLDRRGRVVWAALVAYALSVLAGVLAATLNGFVAPELIGEMLAAEPSERATWDALLTFEGAASQAFAAILLLSSSSAITLWSWTIAKHGALPRAIGLLGLLLAPLTILALLSGHLRLHVHGFGLVVLVQALWFSACGAALWRRRAESVGGE